MGGKNGGYISTSEARKTLANIEKSKGLIKELEALAAPIDSISKNFVPEFIGYAMTHKYRAKNRAGNMGLGATRYTFDKDVLAITNRENLDD